MPLGISQRLVGANFLAGAGGTARVLQVDCVLHRAQTVVYA